MTLKLIDTTKEDRMKRYTQHPFRNLDYHELNSLIVYLSTEKVLLKYSVVISEILYEIFKKLISNLDAIDTHYRKLPHIIEIRPISPLLYMNDIYISSTIHEKEDPSISVYNLLKNALIFSAQKDKSLVTHIIPQISTEESVVFKKLTLDIYCNLIGMYDDKIDELIFSYLDNDDVHSSYYLFIQKIYPSRSKRVQTRYLHRISQIANIDYKNRIIKKLELYEPIHEFLPQKEREWFISNAKSLNYHFRSGFRGKIEVISNRPTRKSFNSVSDMISRLKETSNNYTPDDIFDTIRNNPNEILNHISEFNYIDWKYYPIVFDALTNALAYVEEIRWEDSIQFILTLTNKAVNENEIRLWSSISWFLYHCMLRNHPNLYVYKNYIDRIVQFISSLASMEIIEKLRTASNKSLELLRSLDFCIFNLAFGYDLWLIKNAGKKDLNPILKITLQERKKIEFDGFSTAAAYNFNNIIKFRQEESSTIGQLVFANNSNNSNYDNGIWNIYFRNNSLDLQDEDYCMYFCGITPYLEIFVQNLKRKYKLLDREIIKKIMSFVCGSYLIKCKGSEQLFINLLKSIDHDVKRYIIQLIGNWIKEDDSNLLETERLKVLYDDEMFREVPEFLTWFIHNPFEKEYALDKLFALVRNDSFDIRDSYLLIDSVIDKLIDFIVISPDKVLAIVLILVRKSVSHDLLFHIEKSCYDLIYQIKDEHPISKQICEIFHSHGFITFDR